MSEEYIEIQLDGESAFCRASVISKLKVADAAIFDCDGVLIDTRDSYRKSIVKTVNYIITELTYIKPLSSKTVRETTYLLKKSGGFNNDWDVVYVILLFLFIKLPKAFQDEFIGLTKSDTLNKANLRERFNFFRTSLKSKPSHFQVNLDELTDQLNQFALKADDSGIESIEEKLQDSRNKEMFLAAKRFLNYPGNALESIPSMVFDEVFYGPFLYEKSHGQKCQFNCGIGFVENEKENVLITPALLQELTQVIGKANFGIVSGRDGLSARFSLGETLDMFKRDAVIFLMDVYNSPLFIEEERSKFKKPNPFPLLEASKGLAPFKYSLYVGDSAEDIIMTQRANEIISRFISVGVYSLSNFTDELISDFFKAKTDVILSSIIQLPSLLKKIKEES